MVSTRTRLASLYFRELGPRDGQALIHPICWGDSEPGGRYGRSGQVLRRARGAWPRTQGSFDSAALCWGPEEEGAGGQGGMHSCLPVSTRAGHGLTSASVSLSKTNSST